MSRCGVKSEAARRSAAAGTTAAAWSTGSTMATSLERSESLALPSDSEVSETRSMAAWASSAGTSSAGHHLEDRRTGTAPHRLRSLLRYSEGRTTTGQAASSRVGLLTRPVEGGRSQRVKKASFGSSSTIKPSCSSGAVPVVGSVSRSTRCVLRRKRRHRPALTGKSQAMWRQV